MAELRRIVSPTPSVKKKFAAFQRLKNLGGKFKRSKKVADVIVEAELDFVDEDQIPDDPAFGELDIADLPEPATLAARIRAIVTSLPAPPDPPRPVKSDPPPFDAEGCPIPPSAAIHTKDKKLIALLSSPEVMNGSPDDGRISVWEALNAMDAPQLHEPTNSHGTPGEPEGKPGDDGSQDLVMGDLMLYCPLFPTEDSTVQIAATKTIQVPLTNTESDTLWEARWNLVWSYTVGLIRPAAPQMKLVTKWVPSTTQISFQAMWWGYRIYLPPPVMAHLSSEASDAVRIATTITGVLTWLLAHLNASSVPVPLLPAFLLLQKIGPYAGYIGTFVSWIWGTVTGADKGFGVVLTATWILPVALIPTAIKPPDDSTPAPSAPTTPPSPSTKQPPAPAHPSPTAPSAPPAKAA
ncbi:hypothetical protein R3P38DRAFT_3194388 [Favolaschia claudopus]|uniref:Uncharacterized protein n=1 Tax=Favolaschia claudopus TaxID=2862362 RepID=A0AAW0BCC2_9AGAR